MVLAAPSCVLVASLFPHRAAALLSALLSPLLSQPVRLSMRSVLVLALVCSAFALVASQDTTSVAPQPTLAAPQELKQLTAGSYPAGQDFVGAFEGVPMNPTQHLLKDIQDDKNLVASILRVPMDLGGQTTTRQHSGRSSTTRRRCSSRGSKFVVDEAGRCSFTTSLRDAHSLFVVSLVAVSCV